MSRSVKRTPILSNAIARTEARDKRAASKLLRARERQAAHRGDEVWPLPREVFDMEWRGAKDGKRYSPGLPEGMRK